MELRKPDFYDTFHCIAACCPDSCCKEWDVAVDAEKAALYRALPGALGEKLREFLQDEDGETYLTLDGGRCPMWRADGLCRIQAELGEHALCNTCRDFPRLRHDYGSFTELGLELSCPESARILLSREGWSWVSQGKAEEETDYDQRDMDLLLKTRQAAMDLVTGAEEPLSALLLYTYHAQSILDGEEEAPFDMSAAMEAAGDLAGPGDREAFLEVFRNLEILTEPWRKRLASPSPRLLQKEDRALLRYLISRYWLQAISDFDLVCRGKLIVSLALLCRILGGDAVQTAQLMSKEIENDAENIDTLLDGAYTTPGLTDANLLALARE